jgi:hypothetical protein
MTTQWQAIGAIDPARLGPSRIQLHSAVQLVAAVGKALAHPEPDDSHTSLDWDFEHNAFVGVKVKHPEIHAGLEVPSLTLSLSERSGGVRKLELGGQNLGEAFEWLKATLQEQGAPPERLSMIGDPFQLPESVFDQMDKFDGSQRAEFAEWARQYGNGKLVLEELRKRRPGFSAPRVWPHHFDVGSLWAPKPGQSIGIGLSPGDRSYDEPYWYITPSPHPDLNKLPSLEAGGSWHTQGWVGAVLPASRIVGKSGSEQQSQVEQFVESAVRLAADATT